MGRDVGRIRTSREGDRERKAVRVPVKVKEVFKKSIGPRVERDTRGGGARGALSKGDNRWVPDKIQKLILRQDGRRGVTAESSVNRVVDRGRPFPLVR